jgi:hypothetical protein
MIKKSVYIWPSTKDNIATIDLNFKIASPQAMDEAVKMYLKYLMDLNGKTEKDIIRIQPDTDPEVIKKALRLIEEIGDVPITMEKYGPFVMDGDVKRAISKDVFDYWLASGRIVAASADVYKVRKVC